MKLRIVTVCALVTLVTGVILMGACGDLGAALSDGSQRGPRVAIGIAALSLEGAGDVVWDVEVDNGAGAVVWQRRIASSRYGDGAGSASYVGPCDADPAVAENTVKLWVVGVYAARVDDPGRFNSGLATGDGAVTADAPLDFESPTSATPLTRTVPCRADADAAVTFDVALMRPAREGFFDVAINFNDLFCAAKFDCCEDRDGVPGCDGGGDEDIALLFDASGARGRTFVLGFACTAGLGDADTTLYMDPLELDCTTVAGPFATDLKLIPDTTQTGNQCVAGADGMSTCASRVVELGAVDADQFLFQFAVFRGAEALSSGGVAAQQRYWNVALGVKPGIASCRLRTRATADDANDPDDHVDEGVVAAGAVYPYVTWDVDLGSCASEALTFGSPTAPVRTAYTATSDAAQSFDYVWAPGRAPGPPCATACGAGYACVATNTCADIDECALNNGGCGTFNCRNLPGDFTCVCPDGTLDLFGDATACARFGQVAAGAAHSCAITTDGALYCWGDNGAGQLGDGTTAQRLHPVRVGSDSDWSRVTAGASHSCGLRAGALYCWGDNVRGQLGDGTTVAHAAPAQVGAAGAWTDLAAGDDHSCGVRVGSLYCWGANGAGQLGDSTAVDQTTPTLVGDGTDWTAVVAGGRHSCGLRAGDAWCWGDNSAGQLGDGTTASRLAPVAVVTQPGELGWDALAAGHDHSCGLSAGALWCWGRNASGQLGDGTQIGRAAPTAVGVASDWSGVTAGARHSCGLRSGTLYCWGDGADGQLGDGAASAQASPTAIGAASDWGGVVAGALHTCGARDGRLYCWGDNAAGQIGDGSVSGDVAFPVRVGAAAPWEGVSAGASHSCARLAGRLFCWGLNGSGQLGDGTTTASPGALVAVGTAADWDEVAAGGTHSCGRRAGALFCWGNNSNGQLGDGSASTRTTPTQVGSLTGWTRVAAGIHHSCGVRDGGLYCWGNNAAGQLGVGSLTGATSPVRVGTDSDWTAVAAGEYSSCGLRAGGALYCWGRNTSGQLGDGTASDHSAPAQVGADLGWTTVAVGLDHACAVRAGELYCWGANAAGQLGDGTTTNQASPVRVGGAADWSTVATGATHSCGLRGGFLSCWGGNAFGEVGDATTTLRASPVSVGTASDWTAVAAGSDAHSCGVRAGQLSCWGRGDDGRLGQPSSLTPTPIRAAW